MGLLSPPTAATLQFHRSPPSASVPMTRSPATAPIPVGRSPAARSAAIPPSTPVMYPTTLLTPSLGPYTPKSPPKALPIQGSSTPRSSNLSLPRYHSTPKGSVTTKSFRSEHCPVETSKPRKRSSSSSRVPEAYDIDVFDDSSDAEDYFSKFPFHGQRGRSTSSLPLNACPPFHPPVTLSSHLAIPRKTVSFGLPSDYIPTSREPSRSRSRARNDHPQTFEHYPSGYHHHHEHDRGRSWSRSQSRTRTSEDRMRPGTSSQSPYIPSRLLPMPSSFPAPPPYATPSGGYQIYKPLPSSHSPSAPPPITPMMAYTSPNPGHLHRTSSNSTRSHPPSTTTSSGRHRRYSDSHDTHSFSMASPPTTFVLQPHSIGPAYAHPYLHQHQQQHPHQNYSRPRSNSTTSYDKAMVYQVASSPGYYPVTTSYNNIASHPAQYYYHYHHHSKASKHKSHHNSGSSDAHRSKSPSSKSSRRASMSSINLPPMAATMTSVVARKEPDRERKKRKERERHEKENNARQREKEKAKQREKEEWMRRSKEEYDRVQRRESQVSGPVPMMYGGYTVGVPLPAHSEPEPKPKKQVRFRRGSF